MKNLYKSICVFFIFLCTKCFAQKEVKANATILQGKNFASIDNYVKKIGSLDSLNMATISNILTKNYVDDIDKARAIFDWIAFNISYDIKAARNGGSEKNASSEVLLYRKATGAGYANLFQDMCSSTNIRCLVPDGYIKSSTDEINGKKQDINHRWAVVQLGQSPEAWFYVDACMGSGYPDAEFKTFTRLFDPSYFFANLYVFNLQHYPDNMAWQLGANGPKTKKDFFSLPILKSAAYQFGLKKFLPSNGAVKIKAGKPLSFSYTLSNANEVKKVSLLITEGKKKLLKEIPFTINNDAINFTYKFEEEGNCNITILLNDNNLMEYLVDVE